MQARLSLCSSKTYTDIFILSIARCYLSGVVAKPGIATGSRSDIRAKLAEKRRRNPWVKGSIDCGNSRTRIDPFGPTNLTPMDNDNVLFLCAKLFFEDWISDSREHFVVLPSERNLLRHRETIVFA